jgi:chaperonin cofactor prefoldin
MHRFPPGPTGVGLKIDPTADIIIKALGQAKAKKAAAIRAKRAKGTGKQMDEAQVKEFNELKAQTQGLVRDLNQSKNRQMAMEREIKLSGSTVTHLQDVDANREIYRAVGKSFMFQTKDETIERLNTTSKSLEKQRVEIDTRQKFLERRIKENSSNLEDMLQ